MKHAYFQTFGELWGKGVSGKVVNSLRRVKMRRIIGNCN